MSNMSICETYLPEKKKTKKQEQQNLEKALFDSLVKFLYSCL